LSKSYLQVVRLGLYTIFKQFNSMEIFQKSSKDLGKIDVQHRVLCDWLRNIQQQNTNLARRLTELNKKLDFLLEDNPRPEIEHDNDEGRTVS